MTRILFATPFKPYGIDTAFGRRDSFPEVFHNRVTRAQGVFSYRGFFNAFGLHLIANNISAESDVLEYPTFEAFKRQLRKGYDYVGIGSVVPNFQKVRVMAEAVREISPRSKIVIGGYCADIEDVQRVVPLDYLCTGEGISFMRELLGDPPEYEYRNPDIFSTGKSVMGVPLLRKRNPQIVVGLGCSYGCEYCSSSHHFGRKYIRFYTSGRALYQEMDRLERKYHTGSMSFIGDDNFLLDLNRAEELREAVVEGGKQFEMFFFSSSDRIREFTPARLAEMGANLIWIGRESCLLEQKKNRGIDHQALIEDLHNHGIKVAMSTMLLVDGHTPENLKQDIAGHIAIKPDFSMFTFLSTMPGTPLYDRMKEEGRLLTSFPFEDWTGLDMPHIQHPGFTPQEARQARQEILEWEYRALGPSMLRLVRTEVQASIFLRDAPTEALRRRGRYFAARISNYRALLLAMRRLVPTPEMRDQVDETAALVEKHYGPATTFEKTEAAVLWALGLKQKAQYALLGDVIQPPTIRTRYPGR